LLTGFDRHGTALNDEFWCVHMTGNLICSRVECGEVCFAVVKLWNTDTKEDGIGGAEGGGWVIGECDHSGSAASLDQFSEVRFVNGKTAFVEQPNAFRITIDADDMMTNGCQATASDQTHVAAANYRNLQKSLSGEASHCMTIPLVLRA
jgi:hypothetical protein